MKKYSLNGTWNMSGNGYCVKGTIPGSVYSFLHIDNEILPDPYYRDNEQLYLQIAEHTYTFERDFEYTKTESPAILVCEGLDTLCGIYINGVHIADTDNMHIKYEFDISHAIRSGENRISIVCRPINPYIKEKNAQNKLFGAMDCMAGYPHVRKAHCMMGWDWGPRLPDAGIWKDIYLKETGEGELLSVQLLQRHENGRVFVTAIAKKTGSGTTEIEMTAPNGDPLSLREGVETEIENPALWWPNGLGEQPIYTVSFRLLADGETVDTRVLRVGLRDLKLVRKKDAHGESFYHEVGGVSVFAKGADYIPEDNILSRITPERTRALLENCKACNFNAIRIWGGGFYPNDFFFDLCDELGLIVFFDLMFACSLYDPDEKWLKSVETEIRQNLERVRHHACIGLICGNNEIEWHFEDYVALSGRTDVEHFKRAYLYLFEEMIPSLVKEILPDTAYIPSSPTSSGGFIDPNGQSIGDCHDWSGNYLDCRSMYYRYVSEFGFASFPTIKTVKEFTCCEDRNPNSRIMDLHQRNSLVNLQIVDMLTKHFLYPMGFEEYLYASQILQADIVKYQVEHYRRNRGRCMGTLYWQLNDIWPVTSWASIDYYGRWKALQYAAKRFYAPLLVSCEEIGELQTRSFINAESGTYSKEKSAVLCITNDLPERIGGIVEWQLRDQSSNVLKSGRQEIAVEALSVLRLGKMDFSEIDTQKVHLSYALIVDGKTVSYGSTLFTPPKYYEFVDPKLSCRIESDELVITSHGYAKGVEIEDETDDLILEDNFFDMEKGERRIRLLSGTPSRIRLRSVFDIR